MAQFKGFTPAGDKVESEFKKMTISLWGNTGVGKSFFALTCPQPVYILNFEPEGLSGALRASSQLGYSDLDATFVIDVMRDVFGEIIPTELNVGEQKELYTYVHDVITEVFKDGAEREIGDKGTIVIDTMTTLWKFMRSVTMEEIIAMRKRQNQAVFQFDHGVANQALETFVKSLTTSNFNIVFLSNSQKSYKDKNWDGTYAYYGADRLVNWVDLHGQLIPPKLDRGGNVTSPASYKIEKCRVNRELVGHKIDDPTYDSVVEELQTIVS